MSPWLRRNRWGLVLLIPALALALAASSSRLQLFWWQYKLHEPTHARVGEAVRWVEDAQDFSGPFTRTVTVRVDGVTEVAQPTTLDGTTATIRTPTDAKWLRVRLHVEADPAMLLGGCHLALVDADGRSTEFDSHLLADLDNQLNTSPCTPWGHSGPYSGKPSDLAEAAKDPRPAAYDLDTFVVAARSFTPTEVRIWWATPRYIAVALAGS